jgi:hypothetical protein
MMIDPTGGDRETLIATCREFNARHIDPVLAPMHPDVVLPNGIDGS